MEWKNKTLYERMVDRWGENEAAYSRLKTAKENICNYFRPDLGVDYDEAADMLMLGGDIYEGSGPWVARSASTAFQGNTVSKKLDWFKYGFSDTRIQGIDELDEFCQSVKEHFSAVYQRGNFYDIQPQFTLDGWTIGGPLFFMEEDAETGFVMCIPTHWLTYRIFYDRFNRSEGVIVKDTQWTAKRCFDKFCPGRAIGERLEKAEKIFSISLQDAIKRGNLGQRFTIWRAVFKSHDPIWNGEEGGFEPPVEAGRPKIWYDVYFEDTVIKDKQNDPLLTDGYYSKPYIEWNYNKKFWEVGSRTPAFEAIYDNATMQQIFKNWLDNVQIKVRPAMVALSSMQKRLKFGAQGLTLVDRNEWNYTPKPIENVGDVTLEPEVVRILKENLSRHFHLEMFRMFSDLAQTQKSQDFRVLQLAEMAGERITQLLPTIESHESYLGQVSERVMDIEVRSGRGPFNRMNIENVYDIIKNYLGPDARSVKIQPEFIGTLRQTQQMQQKLKPIQYGIGALSELAASMGDPNFVKFMVKGYDVGDAALQAVNFPQKLVREVEEYQGLVEMFDKNQAMREQFAQMVEMMKASKGNQNAVAPNSVLGMLAGGEAA